MLVRDAGVLPCRRRPFGFPVSRSAGCERNSIVLKILGISTSPRPKGNSDLLLRQALSGAEQAGAQVEYVRLCDYKIEGCRECYACSATGRCQVRDDYQPILDKMLQADRIIFATPVFFMTVPAQAKLLIDRGQCLWVRKTVLGRADGPAEPGADGPCPALAPLGPSLRRADAKRLRRRSARRRRGFRSSGSRGGVPALGS